MLLVLTFSMHDVITKIKFRIYVTDVSELVW